MDNAITTLRCFYCLGDIIERFESFGVWYVCLDDQHSLETAKMIQQMEDMDLACAVYGLYVSDTMSPSSIYCKFRHDK